MQSRTEEFTPTLQTLGPQKKILTSFALYVEYSQRDLAETIRTRRTNYDNATLQRRKELEKEAEAEVNSFRRWIEETKNLEQNTAHYCAVSLKSLLLGLPIGLQIAQLFNVVLGNLENRKTSNSR